MTASSIDSDPYHRAGNASMLATGTVHRRFVRAPHTTTTIATGKRTTNGIGTDAHVPSLPTLAWRTSIQSSQAPGMMTAETATMAAVVPSAMASERHSPRTTNHSRPMPGVILVNRTKVHAAG